MVTVQAALADIREKFKAAGLDTPDLDARLLVQEAIGMKQEELNINSNRLISDSEGKLLNKMVERRLQHEPVSRILGRRGFWKSDFKVSRETLDPRADSETVIETVLKYVNKNKPLSILDLGTGTGCLLLSLLQELPNAVGLGVDISEDAVETARDNAEALELSRRAKFMAADWKEAIFGHAFDLIISNPPYIVDKEIATLAPEVREYDPIQALAGGADGLDCYRDIVNLLPELLVPGGQVFFEIGATQAVAVQGILAERGLYMIKTFQDLAGHDRCVVASMRSDVSVKENNASQ
jgi:release factor glutamine methyltransferase